MKSAILILTIILIIISAIIIFYIFKYYKETSVKPDVTSSTSEKESENLGYVPPTEFKKGNRLLIRSWGNGEDWRWRCPSASKFPDFNSFVKFQKFNDYTKTYETVSAVEGKRGMNVIVINTITGELINHNFDTHRVKYEGKMLEELDKIQLGPGWMVVYLVHDTCTNHLPNDFKDMMVRALPNFMYVAYRSPYIGVLDDFGIIMADKFGGANCNETIEETIYI